MPLGGKLTLVGESVIDSGGPFDTVRVANASLLESAFAVATTWNVPAPIGAV
jgi:hypothetical protein